MNRSPFNQDAFLANFQGMEDLAKETIGQFLSQLPAFISAIDVSIQAKNSNELKIAAHSLKGALSNFYAESSVDLANQLEQLADKRLLTGIETVVTELKSELTRLSQELQKPFNNRKAV